MKVRTNTSDLQRALIGRASALLEADQRVLAAWLEGSFAAGTEDAWSDVDLHTAVADEGYEDYLADAPALLDSLGPVLGLSRARLPTSQILIATLAGPVRLDLFVEPLSAVAVIARPAQPVVLFDRADVTGSFLVDAKAIERLIALRLGALVDEFFTGFMWPARLAGRGEHGSLMANAILILYQFVVPSMLAQSKPADALRAILHNERHLPPEQRSVVDSIAAEIRDAFGEIGGAIDDNAVRRVHERLLEELITNLRVACERYGVDWPAESERATRHFYRSELGLEV